VMGPVELTPVQRWFFAQDFAVPQHFNQSVLVEVEDGIAGADWERVVRRVLEQHDGLRARFVQGADGAWSSELLGVPEVLPWEVCDLSEHTEDRRQGYVSEVAGRVQAGLSLANGLVFRGVLFTGWGDGRDRLLLVAHHLVVDVVSWRVLLEDVETLTGQVRRGEELALPAKSSSWREWARQLAAEASSEKTAAEVPYWREQAETAGTLPVDESADAEGSRVVEAVLGAEETRRLLRDVPAVFNTRVNDVLLTGVARAVGVWCGSAFVRVDVEGHGREDLFGDVDVARTTGWFTTISPLRLPVADADGLGEGLKRVKEVLRERPRQGIGYGLLAHGPVETSLSGAAPAQVSFNYLGQFDDSFAGGFAASSGLAGPDWAAENRRPYPLDIVCHVRDGELHMEWTYDGAVHAEETVRGVAMDTLDALRGIGAQAVRPGAVGYSPSDFPLAELTQERVDALVDSLRTHPVWQAGGLRRPLEDCYPQTPVQQGLWFQSQYAQGEGVYHVQLVLGIDQELDVDAFRRSWSEVMRHHPILRTSFWTTEGSEALQLVWSAPPVPLDVVDWRAEDAEARQGLLDTYLAQDRARGFEPHDAPQWRMLLARTAEDSYQLVWSAHHSILDGWSISLILGEAAAQYGALVQGRPLDRAPGRPYRDYVSWLQRQDLAQAEEYWRDTLQGVDAASPLSIERHPGAGATPVRPGGQAEFVFSFDDELTARLQRMAHANRLTLNTVMQGCWALLLGRYTGGNDVVFGTVVSGRPPEVEGVERMVGLFINTLPVRVGIPDDGTALDWLTDLQERNLRMRQYEHTPLGDIQRWAGLPAGTPLFESLFVFENYPVEKDDKAALRFDLTRSEERIDSPLGVVVTVPDRLHLQVQYDSARFEREAIERLAGHLRSVCGQIAGDPGARLSGISVLTEEERRQVLKHGMSAPRQTAAEADLDLSALAAGLGTAEERELLEQLVAEIQEMSPSDLEAHILKASPATETSENHE
ncbi:condensation domain-containing protein, partial [Streptomyces sp. NPDC050560]|uniref:condensation domain-containing protein n=1 Tax=Streptomyces sp. NPDC050560 TaxID=3365630 RepID=UPI003794E90F